MVKIILYEPQIPQNTGNIVRTCKAVGASLVLVKPLGFSITSRHLKRAGLDYWEGVEVAIIEDLYGYLEKIATPFYFFSSKGKRSYDQIVFQKEDILIFGSETQGMADIFWQKWPDFFYQIPMKPETRCLNLSNSVAIVAYEALRQRNFIFD